MKKYLDNSVLVPELGRLVGEGRAVTLMVRGNSMLPFLADGRDAVTLRRCRPDRLSVGDVVMVRTTDGRTVLHRIIRREGNRLHLQGDGNVYQTEEAMVEEVWAVVSEVTRKGRRYRVNGMVWRGYSWIWRRLGVFGRRCVLALYRRI